MLQYMQIIELHQFIVPTQAGTTACQVQTRLQRGGQGCSLPLHLVLAAGSTGRAAAGAAAAFLWAAAAWVLLMLMP
jgi:hypothetical protein